MYRCLICDNNIEETFNCLVENYKLCYKCICSFKKRNSRFVIGEAKGNILYYYNDFFKDVLFRYKGLGDYVLKDAFFAYNLNKLKRKYKGYVIIPAPSNKSIEEKRGFSHLEEIFKSLNLPIIKCFKKECEWKQSDKTLKERKSVQNIIKIDKSMLKGVKKALLVDDVLTSGSTITAMNRQMPPNITKKILVLSSNCRILRNEII